jgi:ABC-type lipoprotein export system ATPase subunit
MASIQCVNVDKSFGKPPLRILKNVSLTIQPGEFAAITGRSGSGKSTLLYIASSLDNPSDGTVLLDGHDVHTMSQPELHRFRNRCIGFVFQFHYLLPELTAYENVILPAIKAGEEKTRRDRAMSLIEEFSIMHCVKKLPAQMSGGEMQRTAIARSLVMEPSILFADEPTGNLDSENGERVMKIFNDINRNHGTTIMMVTHEADFAKLATRHLHMADGVITEETCHGTSKRGKRK